MKHLGLFYGPTLSTFVQIAKRKSLVALTSGSVSEPSDSSEAEALDDEGELESVLAVCSGFGKGILLTRRVKTVTLYREAVRQGRAFLDGFLKHFLPRALSPAMSSRGEEGNRVVDVLKEMQQMTR